MLIAESSPVAPAAPSMDVGALKRGDPHAFAELVRQHAPMVAGVCQSIGLRGADADDATAEAFAAVFRALPGFEMRAQLSTWIYRIAFRQVLREAQRSHLRRRRTRGDGDAAEILADLNAAPPGHAIEAAEQRERLWAVVRTLEPRQALAVDLFYRRGLDVASVAEVLECPANTVKTLLSRARQRLKIILDQDGVTP